MFTTYFCFTIGILKVDDSSGRNLETFQVTFPVGWTQLFQPQLLGPLFAASTSVSLDAQCCVPLAWFRQTSRWSIRVQFAASSVHTDLRCWT